jgi:hypothetical protein
VWHRAVRDQASMAPAAGPGRASSCSEGTRRLTAFRRRVDLCARSPRSSPSLSPEIASAGRVGPQRRTNGNEAGSD